MAVKRLLLGRAQRAVHGVGQHRLAHRAGRRLPAVLLFELDLVRHLHHLPFYTFQKSCEFTAPAADPALHGALRNA